MTQALDTLVREVESGECHLTYQTLGGRDVREAERIVDSFVSVLRRMTREERISASRHGGFTRWERWVCNHAEWYVEKVERAAERYGGATSGSVSIAESASCTAEAPGGAIVRSAIRLFAPRAFKPLPAALWIGGGSPQSVDARIWPDAVWLLENYDLRVTAAREAGHSTHGDGTAMDMVPAPGRGWDGTALRASLDLGWIPSCGASGSAPVCPLVPAIQFIGYNGYESHGDPSHAGSNAHLHVSWRSSEYGCPGLCEPREWVEVFPWQE